MKPPFHYTLTYLPIKMFYDDELENNTLLLRRLYCPSVNFVFTAEVAVQGELSNLAGANKLAKGSPENALLSITAQ